MCEVPKPKVQLGILSFFASPLIAIHKNGKGDKSLPELVGEVAKSKNKPLQSKSGETCNSFEINSQTNDIDAIIDSDKDSDINLSKNSTKEIQNESSEEIETTDISTPVVGQDVDDNACNSFERKDVPGESEGNSSSQLEPCNLKDNSKPPNAFSFMMKNRHKQNEVIKKMAEEERLREIEDSLQFGQTSTPNKEFGSIQTTWKENESSLTFSPQSAFAMLMPTKKKQISAEEKDDPDYDPFSDIFAKKSKHSKKSHKRLTKILDSSLEDFEEIFSASRNSKSTVKHTTNALSLEKNSCSLDNHLGIGEGVSTALPDKNSSRDSSKDHKKLDLINDEEVPLLEETFKDEILECVSKPRKKVKKRKPSKLEDGVNDDKGTSKRKPKSSITSENFSPPRNSESLPSVESKTCCVPPNNNVKEVTSDEQSPSIQAGILSYFKQVPKRENCNAKEIKITVDVHVQEIQDKTSKMSKYSKGNKPRKKVKSKSADLDKISVEESIDYVTKGEDGLSHDALERENSSGSSVHCIEYNSIKIDEIVESAISGEAIKSDKKETPVNKLDISSLLRPTKDGAGPQISNSKTNNSNELFSIFQPTTKKSRIACLKRVRIFKDSGGRIDPQLPSNNSVRAEMPKLTSKSLNSVDSELCEKVIKGESSISTENTGKNNSFSKFIEANTEARTKSEIIYDVEDNMPKSSNIQEKVRDCSESDKEVCTPKGNNLEEGFPSPQSESGTPNHLRRSSRKVKRTQTFEAFLDQELELKIYKTLQKKEKCRFSNLMKDHDVYDPEKENESKTKSTKKSSRRREKGKRFQEGTKTKEKIGKEVKSSSLNHAHDKKARKQHADSDTDEEIIILGSSERISKEDMDSVTIIDEKKLAPIFTKKNSQSERATLSPSKLKARHDFLFSEVPDEVKKCLSSPQSNEDLDIHPCFPSISHITQSSKEDDFFNLPNPDINCFIRGGLDIEYIPHLTIDSTQPLIDKRILSPPPEIGPSPPLNISTLCHILYHLKNKNPSFPVYSVFKNYLDSKEEAISLYKKELEADKLSHSTPECQPTPEKKRKRKSKKPSLSKKRRLSRSNCADAVSLDGAEEILSESETPWHQWIPFGWNQVFAPKSSLNVIGNSAFVSELKQWLGDWKKNIETQTAKEKGTQTKKGSTSCDSNNSDDGLVNAYLLCGPSGVGKTCAVYAIAQDLGFEVLEVNASSRRQGKQVMSQLSEATQSHIVSSGCNFTLGSSSNCSSSNAQESGRTCKPQEKRKDKASKQQSCVLIKGNNLSSQSRVENVQEGERRKNMALILFKDIDIVFEESDDGFLSTVSSFMSTTKRPIILTTSNPTPCSKAKIKGAFSELNFTRPKPEDVAQYLQLMCLAASGVFSSAKEVEALVASNKGDIRKTILALQFWSLSGSCKVQWLKMYRKNFSNAKTDIKQDNDIDLSQIFKNYSLRKSVDVPISLGCSWSRSDLEDFKESRHVSNNWTLVSGNVVSLLPFNLKLNEAPVPKYPLRVTDPTVKKLSIWQRYSWLTPDLDSEDEAAVEEVGEEEEVQPQEPLPPEITTVASKCVHSLASFYNSLATLDALNSNEAVNDDKDFGKWWKSLVGSELEWVTDKNDPTPTFASSSLVTDLSSSLAAVSYGILHREIQEHLQTIDCRREWPPLTVPVETIPPSLFLHPHQFASIWRHHRWNTLNQKATHHLPLLSQPLRTAAAKDYMPYLRSFARSDQLGEAFQRLRRGRRFLSHMKQLGFYLSSEECIDLSNLF